MAGPPFSARAPDEDIKLIISHSLIERPLSAFNNAAFHLARFDGQHLLFDFRSAAEVLTDNRLKQIDGRTTSILQFLLTHTGMWFLIDALAELDTNTDPSAAVNTLADLAQNVINGTLDSAANGIALLSLLRLLINRRIQPRKSL
jgi:hypothetical protein